MCQGSYARSEGGTERKPNSSQRCPSPVGVASLLVVLSWFYLHPLSVLGGKPCPLLDSMTARCVVTLLGRHHRLDTEMMHLRLHRLAVSFVSSHTRDYVFSYLDPNCSPIGLALIRGPSLAAVLVEVLRQSPVILSERHGFAFRRLLGASGCPATPVLLLGRRCPAEHPLCSVSAIILF